QEVKKDVSSLRYITLPNWVHDALLESSSSKPQDDCSTDVHKSSGNFNPTATSTNPSTDQLETLTVETPIPTVSSPVLIAFFTDSPEPLSDTRLISKRVANQVETPSLDNILTLANWFEDILGVTTNSDESNGVEADLCREFEALMHEKFQMSAMGELNFFLGLQVLQKDDGIFLSQDKYVGDILKKFGYSDVRSSNTLMDKENP
nr:putative ribonuclease H-like domain-containing protein [Tanacetum cinerariifolium]